MNTSVVDILKNKLLVPFVFLFIPLSAFAENTVLTSLGLTGSLRTGYWSENKDFTADRNFWINSAWIKATPDEVSGFKFVFDGFYQNELQVREAFISKSLGNFDFHAGRQILVWGRSDQLNPTDQWSSKNYRLLLTDVEEQRLGALSASVAYHFGDLKFAGYWTPEWREPVFPIPDQRGIRLISTRPNHPAHEYGLKLDQTGGELDWSLSYYDGFNRVPNLELLSASSNGVDVKLRYDRIQVYGFDFAKNINSYAFRGEFAFLETADHDGLDPFTQNSNFTGVLGADHDLFESFNLNLQFLYKHVFDFQEPSSVLSAQLSQLSRQQYSNDYAFSLHPSYKMWNDTLEVEISYFFWLRKGDSVFRPKVTYALTDHFKTIFGGEWYAGPSDSFFGSIQNSSSFFCELRFNF